MKLLRTERRITVTHTVVLSDQEARWLLGIVETFQAVAPALEADRLKIKAVLQEIVKSGEARA